MGWLKSKFEFYEVSNEGLVRSVDKMVKCNGNSTRVCKGKLLKMVTDKDGYYTVCIHDNGAQFPYFVHRLVAEAFIPNSDNCQLLTISTVIVKITELKIYAGLQCLKIIQQS